MGQTTAIRWYPPHPLGMHSGQEKESQLTLSTLRLLSDPYGILSKSLRVLPGVTAACTTIVQSQLVCVNVCV